MLHKIGLVFSRMRALPQFCKLCKLHNEKEVALIQKRSSMSTHNHIKLTTNFLCHKIDNLFTYLHSTLLDTNNCFQFTYIPTRLAWSQLKIGTRLIFFLCQICFHFIDGAVLELHISACYDLRVIYITFRLLAGWTAPSEIKTNLA